MQGIISLKQLEEEIPLNPLELKKLSQLDVLNGHVQMQSGKFQITKHATNKYSYRRI